MAANSKRKQAGRAPISSHPTFPAIVALWFAALFGIGSMVLPVVLLEKLVTATGIASLVPAAAPPLGVTARILIALVAAGLGVVLGVVLARRVAAAQAAQPAVRRAPSLRAVDAHPDAPAKRPISARQELGSETLDEPFDVAKQLADLQFAEPMPGRRRALSVTDESGRSEFLGDASLPYGDAGFSPTADIGDDENEDALELECVELTEEAPAIADVAMPQRNNELHAATEATDEVIREPKMDMEAQSQPDDRQDFAAPVEVETAARPFNEPGVAFTAEAAPAEEQAAFTAPEPETSVPAEPAAPEQRFSPAPIDGPLAELSVAQLVERFALALQTKAAEASPPSEAVAANPSEVAFEPSSAPAYAPAASFAEPDQAEREPLVAKAPASFDPPADAGQIMAAQVADHAEEAGPLPGTQAPEPIADKDEDQDLTVPAALRPLDLGEFADDEDETDDDLAGLSLQLGGSAKPFARPANQPEPSAGTATPEEAEDGFEDDTGDEGYSSLLNMKRPLPTGQEFVRIEDEGEDGDTGAAGPEPVVVFPNQQDRRAAHPAAGAMPTAPAGQPAGHARPFDAPSASESGFGNGSFAPAAPTNPPANRIDPGETEKALREALEKLQRMSGAA